MLRLTIKFYLSILLMMSMTASLFIKLEAITLESFSSDAKPFIFSDSTHLKIKNCEVGDVAEKLQTINEDLQARFSVQPLTNDEISRIYDVQFKQLSTMMICNFQAANLGITQLPAIVLNHHYVIYGQQNIDLAVQEYQDYVERQHV